MAITLDARRPITQRFCSSDYYILLKTSDGQMVLETKMLTDLQ
jgi:hypothetical protein